MAKFIHFLNTAKWVETGSMHHPDFCGTQELIIPDGA